MDMNELYEQVIDVLDEGGTLEFVGNLKTPEGTQILVRWTRPGSPGPRAAFAHNLGEALRKVLHYEEQVDEAAASALHDDPSVAKGLPRIAR